MVEREIAHLKNINKSFGAVKALVDVDLSVETGTCLGLVGYNGAGKSTLMHILAGTQAPDSGQIIIEGRQQENYSVTKAHSLGIRCVFQELSLCPNLSVVENTKVLHHSLKGWGWRKRATKLISDALDEIFPDHGIQSETLVSDLPIGKRQMVEIARAFTVTDDPLDLVILDEPTSSLDVSISSQLLRYIRTATKRGQSIIMISHILNEVLECADDVAVMRDARIVSVKQACDLDRNKMVALMGEVHQQASNEKSESRAAREQGETVVSVRWPTGDGDGEDVFVARKGEIVGLSGLAGHGQTKMLLKLFEARGKSSDDTVVKGQVAYVSGDRQYDGIFPLWSIVKNISVCSYRQMRRRLLIDKDLEWEMSCKWQDLIRIKTPDIQNNIFSLSGGNQQKVLFARALGSVAEIVLMDDPMRGVDVDTKREVYDLIQAEADNGRCFIWYTTEMAELEHCDRVYIFQDNRIVSHLTREEISEDRILQSAFTGTPKVCLDKGPSAAGDEA